MVGETLCSVDLGGLHALAIHAWTPEEWFDKGKAPESPPCEGGGKR